MYGRDGSGAATLRYGDGTYEVIRAGGYVVCAVSGHRILLEDLRYWSVDRQEAYASPRQALQRHEEVRAASGGSPYVRPAT